MIKPTVVLADVCMRVWREPVYNKLNVEQYPEFTEMSNIIITVGGREHLKEVSNFSMMGRRVVYWVQRTASLALNKAYIHFIYALWGKYCLMVNERSLNEMQPGSR